MLNKKYTIKNEKQLGTTYIQDNIKVQNDDRILMFFKFPIPVSYIIIRATRLSYGHTSIFTHRSTHWHMHGHPK